MRRAALALALIATGCGGEPAPRSPAPTPSSSSPPVEPARPSHEPPPDEVLLARAVEIAFPKGNRVSLDGQAARVFDEHRLVRTPSGLVLVSAGHMPDGPHAAGGLLAVFGLSHDDDGNFTKADAPRTFELGSFGTFGEWSVSEAFAEVPTIRAEGGGTWQGYSCSYVMLVELRPRPVEVASVRIAYDNEGAVEQGDEKIAGTIADIERGKGFTVRYGGTRGFAERYVLRAGRYVREGGKTRLPAC